MAATLDAPSGALQPALAFTGSTGLQTTGSKPSWPTKTYDDTFGANVQPQFTGSCKSREPPAVISPYSWVLKIFNQDGDTHRLMMLNPIRTESFDPKHVRQSQRFVTAREFEEWGVVERAPPKTTFMDLPANVRNQIYEMVLVADAPIDVLPAHAWSRAELRTLLSHPCRLVKTKFSPQGIQPQLLRVSKLVAAEANGIFYGSNKFRIISMRSWSRTLDFFRSIGLTNRDYISHIIAVAPFAEMDMNRQVQEDKNIRIASATIECCRLLQKMPYLRSLELVENCRFNRWPAKYGLYAGRLLDPTPGPDFQAFQLLKQGRPDVAFSITCLHTEQQMRMDRGAFLMPNPTMILPHLNWQLKHLKEIGFKIFNSFVREKWGRDGSTRKPHGGSVEAEDVTYRVDDELGYIKRVREDDETSSPSNSDSDSD